MARYETPPDPRTTPLHEQRQRRQRQDGSEPIPWLWFGLGVLVTVAGIFLAISLADRLLSRPPLNVVVVPTPTIIYLTAPATQFPTPTPLFATPSPIPTLTPIPTANLATPPPEITIGYYAQVINTEGLGVTVRGGPDTSNVPVVVAPEGAILLIIGGPEQGGDFSWWQVRLQDDTEGWVAANFLQPAAEP